VSGDQAARLDYLRRAYESTREWYSSAETKAQLLLTINGLFITVLFSSVLGKADDARKTIAVFGSETWVFLGLALAAIIAAVCSATLTMWSRHGSSSSDELGLLGVQADDPDSYVPEVLWYFGHIARLDPSHVKDKLLNSDAQFEAIAISNSLIKLSHRVLRKHNCVNAGWISIAFALVMLAFAVSSITIRL
jgi:hypothetical protein